MVIQLSDGKYLHTAYAISNIAEELGTDDWSLTDQEGMLYIGTYIDGNSVDSTDPTAYNWEELVDEDVDDEDSEGIMPVADFQSQIDALADQIGIQQSTTEGLQESIDNANQNLSSSTELANNAQQIAGNTNQYFWHTESGTDTGAHITEIPQEQFLEDPSNGGGNLLARSNGIAVRDGLEELSTFGADGISVGKTGQSHLEIDYHSMQMVDSDGETYFHVSDLRNEDGYIVQTETGDGTAYIFQTTLQVNEVISVTVDGATVSATADGNVVTLDTVPSSDAEIIITYIPYPLNLAKAYTFGQRADGEPIGAMSVAEGVDNSASGNYSHVEGGNNIIDNVSDYAHAEGRGNVIISAPRGHAEGVDNRVENNNAHAEGMTNQALGEASHVEGVGNIATAWGQHVVGRFNSSDANKIEIVGNGASTSVRSNARTLTLSGQEWLADTLVVSRNPTAPMEVATKDYVDNSGGGTVTAEDVTVDGSDFAQNPEWSEALDQSGNVQEALTYLSLIAYDTTDQVIALEGSKQDSLISGSNIKTINGNSILGSGNLVIGGGGGTSDYSNLTNKPKINSVELSGNKSLSDLGITLANLGGVPTTRTINGNALTSNITLDATDVGALPDTTVIPTKVSDLTNDSGFIPKDDLFFKPGDVYSVTYNHARALTGYVSSSTKGMYFEVPLPKFLTDVSSATITAMTGGVRGINGYVNGLTNGSNLKSGYTVTASVDNPNTLYVSVVSANTLSGVSNNTPISVALNSISITFS